MCCAPQRAAAHDGWGVEEWDQRLFGVRAGIDRVVAASVAGAEQARAGEAASRHGMPTCNSCASTASGLRRAQCVRRSGLLGVDRWVAVIGAHHLTRSAGVLRGGRRHRETVDAVTADGAHLGGFIVPGPQLMVELAARGHQRPGRAHGEPVVPTSALFADNTRDAIERGCRITLAALVDRAHGELARPDRTHRPWWSPAGQPARCALCNSPLDTCRIWCCMGSRGWHGRGLNRTTAMRSNTAGGPGHEWVPDHPVLSGRKKPMKNQSFGRLGQRVRRPRRFRLHGICRRRGREGHVREDLRRMPRGGRFRG